jgi:RNA polymerase sigma factor (sigma-70 family)
LLTAQEALMAEAEPTRTHRLLYHFCRLRLPAVGLPFAAFARRLGSAYELYRAKRARGGEATSEREFLENLHAVDFFLASACLEGQPRAWEALFNARASRTEALLVDALRQRAVRLFPRDAERQNEAVDEFWGFLLAGERSGSLPILARYDGQRPLVPWLIRVFQNKHLSDLRQHRGAQAVDNLDLQAWSEELLQRDLSLPSDGEERWHHEFREAAREWFAGLSDQDVLLLGLRLRYRLSQREVAGVLGIHEGNVSRQTARLRDRCLEQIGQNLRALGWTGDDLDGFVFKEMDSLLLDELRLSADRLAALLAGRGPKRQAASGTLAPEGEGE